MNRLSNLEVWYARLLQLYPRAYVRRFGPEMQQNFRDLYREDHRSLYSQVTFSFGMVRDLGSSLAAQYIELIRRQNMFELIKRSRLVQVALVCAVIVFGVGSWQFLLLRQAHSSFQNYAQFRGCERITSRTAANGTCVLPSGQTITMVLFQGEWYLQGDLPYCLGNVCL